MADQLERNAASQVSAETSSHNQQFRQHEKEEESYSSANQRKIYHSMQQSFNEQREEYAEQAFNTYGYEKGNSDTESSTSKTDTDTGHTASPASATPESPETPPAPPTDMLLTEETPAAYDSALDKLVKKRTEVIKKENEIYHSIKGKKTARLYSYKAKLGSKRKGLRMLPPEITDHKAAHRLVEDKKRSVKAAYYSKDHHDQDRMVFKGIEKKHTKKEYDRRAQKAYRKKYKRDFILKNAARKGRLLFDNESMPDDEDAATMERALKKGARTGQLIVRKSVQGINRETNKYARLKTTIEKEKLLDEKIDYLSNKSKYKQEHAAIMAEWKQTKGEIRRERLSDEKSYHKRREGLSDEKSCHKRRERLSDEKSRHKLNDQKTACNKELQAEKLANAKAIQKKKLKQAHIHRKEQEGNFFRRTWNSIQIKKKSVEYQAKRKKSMLSVVLSTLLIFIVLLFSNMFVYIFGMMAFQGASESYIQTIVQVDYGVMSECTAYYRSLETDLTEKLMNTDTLEEELRETYGEDIYEYVYELAEIGFDSTTLVAYLGAKYVEFTLEDVQAELDELFSLNYILQVETRMEYREEADAEVKICYVRLEKVPLEDIVAGRMTEEQLRQYEIYKMSSGGQQVYGPVMLTDWTNLITSNFGERIHPITGERTKHKGVDIGVPVGTPLYSAVDGTVTVAQYSETAGNFIRIQNVTGWTVTFMHMDSISVSAGTKVKKGDFVGYSGNTGRSTGPHLHLEVWDAEGNPVNPIFIIPQSCVMITD